MKVLAISGSLRKGSYNSAIVNSLKTLHPHVEIFKALEKLPPFNPDLDKHTLQSDASPDAVKELRDALKGADVLLISSPEYAFEIPGVLKNALDWLVSSGELVNKPVGVITASTSALGGESANRVLCALVKVLSGKISPETSLSVSMVNKRVDESGKIIDERLVSDIKNILKNLKKSM